jgi:hypothetical protein
VAPIHKDAKGQHSKYATIQSVLAAITPTLTECGLAVTQTFSTDIQGRQLLITTLRHVSGQTITSSVPLVAEGGRNALHAWGGAVTYQRRYALLAMLNLAAGIDDDDGDSLDRRIQKPSPVTDGNDFF